MSTTATVTSPPSRPSLLPAPSNPSSYRSPNDPRSRPPRTIRRVRSKTDPNIEFSLSDIKRQDQNQSSSHPPASPVDGGGSGIGGGHNQRRASIENSALLSSATAFEAQAHALAQAQAQRTGPVHKSRYSVASIPLPFTHRQGRSSTSNDPSNPRIEPSQSQSHNQHDHYQHPQQHPQQQQQNSGGTRPSSLTKPLASSTASRVPGLRSWQRQSSGTVPVQAAGGAASASAGANPSASASASASASGSGSASAATTTSPTSPTSSSLTFPSPRKPIAGQTNKNNKAADPDSARDAGIPVYARHIPRRNFSREAKEASSRRLSRAAEQQQQQQLGDPEGGQLAEAQLEDAQGRLHANPGAPLTLTRSAPSHDPQHSERLQQTINQDQSPSSGSGRAVSSSSSSSIYQRKQQRPGSSYSETTPRPVTSPTRSTRLFTSPSRSFSASVWSAARAPEHRLPTIPSSLTGDTDRSVAGDKPNEETQGDNSGAISRTSSDSRRTATRLSSFRSRRQNSDYQGRLSSFSRRNTVANSNNNRNNTTASFDTGSTVSTPPVLVHPPSRDVMATTTARSRITGSYDDEGAMADHYEGRKDFGVQDSPKEPRFDTSSKESMAGSGKSVKGEDLFLNIARSSSTRKIARNSMPAIPKDRRSSRLGISSRLGSRIVSNDDSPVSPPLGSPVRKSRHPEDGQEKEPRARRSPSSSLHPLDEASRMRYFGRHPRSLDPGQHPGDRSPSAIDGRFPRSNTVLDYSTSQSHNHQPPYIPNSKQGAGSSLSSSTHNSRSWGSSCSTEKQQYAQQAPCVPEEPEDTSSTVWNELDDLKSRIKRLEITGKMEPSSNPTHEKDERPKTAATESSRYIMQSPKRSQSATGATPPDPKSHLEGSVTPSNGSSSAIDVNQLHPLLHTSLAKAKPHLGVSVFRALHNTVQDALVLAALLGSTATGATSTVAIPNGNNNGVGLPMGANDRQARRKADTVCRDLTELALALSDEMINLSKQNGRPEYNGADGPGDANAEGVANGAVAPYAEYDSVGTTGGADNINGYGDCAGQVQPNNYIGHNENYYSVEMGQAVQQPPQAYGVMQRMPSTAARRENRNSALLNPPPGPLNTNISPRNSLIIDPASGTSSQTQISSSDASFAPVQFPGAPTANKSPMNTAAVPAMASSPSRLSRLSTVFKTRRLQQQIGIDTAPEHVMDDQVAQSPVPISAVPGGNPGVKSRTTSRVSFANGPPNQGRRLSSVASGTRERRFSRGVHYEPDFQSQQQQQQQGQSVQGRPRPQGPAFSRVQAGSVTPQFSYQSPLRSRTFAPQGSVQSSPQQQQSAGSTISTHVPLANQSNMNIQPGFRRFGLSSMLGKKHGLSNGDSGMSAVNSPSSPAVSNFNIPNANEEMNPSSFQNYGVRPRNTQPLNLRPRTRSVGNSAQAPMAPQQDGANANMAYGNNQQASNINGLKRVSLRPRLRSTHSTEGL